MAWHNCVHDQNGPVYCFTAVLGAQTQQAIPKTLKDILLEELKYTHDKKGGWFVSLKTAVNGITPEQAQWTDGKGNHSIGQLVNHLAFWNARNLETFKGEKPAAYNGNNDETFISFDSKTWTETVNRADSTMKGWEDAVSKADAAKMNALGFQVANIVAHNAYHIGQIVYIRKLQGSWNPENGVK